MYHSSTNAQYNDGSAFARRVPGKVAPQEAQKKSTKSDSVMVFLQFAKSLAPGYAKRVKHLCLLNRGIQHYKISGHMHSAGAQLMCSFFLKDLFTLVVLVAAHKDRPLFRAIQLLRGLASDLRIIVPMDVMMPMLKAVGMPSRGFELSVCNVSESSVVYKRIVKNFIDKMYLTISKASRAGELDSARVKAPLVTHLKPVSLCRQHDGLPTGPIRLNADCAATLDFRYLRR